MSTLPRIVLVNDMVPFKHLSSSPVFMRTAFALFSSTLLAPFVNLICQSYIMLVSLKCHLEKKAEGKDVWREKLGIPFATCEYVKKKYSIKQSLLSISVHTHTFTNTCILASMQDFLSKIAFCQRAYLSGEMSVKIKCQGENNLLLSAYRWMK